MDITNQYQLRPILRRISCHHRSNPVYDKSHLIDTTYGDFDCAASKQQKNNIQVAMHLHIVRQPS